MKTVNLEQTTLDDCVRESRNALGDEKLNLRDVVRHAGHQLPGLIAVVEAHRLRLEVPVEDVTEVENDHLADELFDVGLDREESVGNQCREDETDEIKRQERDVVLRHVAVDDELGEPGRPQAKGREAEDEDDVDDREQPVWAHELEKP